MAVFHDPLALSRLDDDHGADEERWITLGAGPDVRVLLVVHTYVERSDDLVTIRVISARRATRRETAQYAEGA